MYSLYNDFDKLENAVKWQTMVTNMGYITIMDWIVDHWRVWVQ